MKFPSSTLSFVLASLPTWAAASHRGPTHEGTKSLGAARSHPILGVSAKAAGGHPSKIIRKKLVDKGRLANKQDDKDKDDKLAVVCDPQVATIAAAVQEKDAVGILTCKESEYCFATSEKEWICVPIEYEDDEDIDSYLDIDYHEYEIVEEDNEPVEGSVNRILNPDNSCPDPACIVTGATGSPVSDTIPFNDAVSNFLSGDTTYGNVINCWNVSAVTDMRQAFFYQLQFNQRIDCWDVSSVTDMSLMFFRAPSFNQMLDSWDVSSVNNMDDMFNTAVVFNQMLDSWDISSVTKMGGMFYEAPSFNQMLDSWNISSVISMVFMFSRASSFNQMLDSWDISSVTSMDYMFYQASSFNQDLCLWDGKAAKGAFVGSMFVDTNCSQPADPAFPGSDSWCQTCALSALPSMSTTPLDVPSLKPSSSTSPSMVPGSDSSFQPSFMPTSGEGGGKKGTKSSKKDSKKSVKSTRAPSQSPSVSSSPSVLIMPTNAPVMSTKKDKKKNKKIKNKK